MAATGGAGTAAAGAATGGAAAGATKNAYIIMGHGIEKPIDFNKRITIPPGVTLVVYSQCGDVTDTDLVLPFIERFVDKSNEAEFLNPTDDSLMLTIPHKFSHGRTFKIFREGDQYPKLSVRLLLTMEEEEKHFNFMKSGIYRLGDTTLEDWKINPTAPPGEGQWNIQIPWEKVGYNYKIDKSVLLDKIPATYAKSVFPTESDVTKIIDGLKVIKPTPSLFTPLALTKPTNTVSEKEKILSDEFQGSTEWEITLKDIFDQLRSGVYYWPVCRGIIDMLSIADYVRRLKVDTDKSLHKTLEERWGNVMYKNFTPLTNEQRNSIYKRLDENLVNPALVEDHDGKNALIKVLKETLSNTDPKRAAVLAVRQSSINAQKKLVCLDGRCITTDTGAGNTRRGSTASTVVAEPNNMGGGSRRRRRKTRRRKRVAKRRVTRRH